VTTTYVVDTFNPTGYAQAVTEKVPGTSPQSLVYGLERIAHFRQFYNQGRVNESVYYVYDGHGSVRALTDATYDYDAFGNLIRSTGTTPNNYLFAGEQFDPEPSLCCFNVASRIPTRLEPSVDSCCGKKHKCRGWRRLEGSVGRARADTKLSRDRLPGCAWRSQAGSLCNIT
jgi:hypothetical protein